MKKVEFRTPAFTCRMAKKRVKNKVSPALPKRPAKKAEIIQNLANSPGTRKILGKKQFLKSNEEEKKIEALQCLVEDVSEGLSKMKKAKTTDERAAYSSAHFLAFGSSVKQNRHQKRIASMMGIKRMQMSEAIKNRERVLKGDEACWSITKRRGRCDAIKEEENQLIYDFWALQVVVHNFLALICYIKCKHFSDWTVSNEINKLSDEIH